MHLNAACGIVVVVLDSQCFHFISGHHIKHFISQGVMPQAGDQYRILPECLEMPRNVERCTAQNDPVRKNVRQYLAEQYDRTFSTEAGGRRGYSWICVMCHRIGLTLYQLANFSHGDIHWFVKSCRNRRQGRFIAPNSSGVDRLHNDLYQ
jgi:hypothetical protein